MISVDAEKSLFFDEESTQQTRMEEDIIKVIMKSYQLKNCYPEYKILHPT